MNAKETYLRGKSIFIVSLLVISVTILTVYLTGLRDHRGFVANANLILGIVGFALFLFLIVGLYKGIGLKDDFPKVRDFKHPDGELGDFGLPDIPSVDGGEGEGIILSILLWVVMSIALFVLFLFLEGIVIFFLFSLLVMIYWVFFRALRLVFSRSSETQGKLMLSGLYSLGFTVLYLGWIFGLVYLTKAF